MNIAVYSGSFNPLHIGHLAIIRHMIDEAGFDCVYLVVSPKNPLKEGISADSGLDRYNAAVAAVARHFSNTGRRNVNDCERAEHIPISLQSEPQSSYLPSDRMYSTYSAASEQVRKVIVDDIELRMPPPHYTIRTLDALKEREPYNTFTLIMGADNLADIRRWRDYTRILKEYGVAVFPRTGIDLSMVKTDLLTEDPSFHIRLLDAEMVDISSTTIRNALAEGQDMSAWLM